VRYAGFDQGPSTWIGVGGSPTTPPTYPTPLPLSAYTSELYSYGATGYKKTRPGNPIASLGQFLIELRDLPVAPGKALYKNLRVRTLNVPIRRLPGVLLQQLSGFRALGGEYLNVVFGWKPFVSDLRKMYNLWQVLDKRMAQIRRENGRYIRRRATLFEDTSTSQTTIPKTASGVTSELFWGGGLATKTVTTKTKIWYSASYRYYIPDTSEGSLWDLRAKAALFGALPTPELLWEVLPWSWLIDWFANFGDVVSNFSPNAVDNLTQRYAFTMKHVVEETEWKFSGSVPPSSAIFGSSPSYSWSGLNFNLTSKQRKETKIRLGGGNPFGMGVQFNSLSSGQLAILGALGISRGLVK
jgi:hypothetical protein